MSSVKIEKDSRKILFGEESKIRELYEEELNIIKPLVDSIMPELLKKFHELYTEKVKSYYSYTINSSVLISVCMNFCSRLIHSVSNEMDDDIVNEVSDHIFENIKESLFSMRKEDGD